MPPVQLTQFDLERIEAEVLAIDSILDTESDDALSESFERLEQLEAEVRQSLKNAQRIRLRIVS